MDPLKHLPGYALRRASAATMAELARSLAPLDIRFGEAALLMQVDANPGITQSEVGRVLDIQRANMVPLTARLHARALIERVPVDGRSQGLTLTPAGTALCGQVTAVIAAHETALLARVPERHRAHLLPALAALWSEDDGDG